MAAMVEPALLEDIAYTNIFGHLILEKNWLYFLHFSFSDIACTQMLKTWLVGVVSEAFN